MRAARLIAWGDVRVEEVPTPRVGPGEALVRIEACGVCGSDALRWYVERKAPAVLGHEPAGVIVAVGDGVESVKPGDRVFVHHHAPCGTCGHCRRGAWSGCATWRANRLDPGGFAEYARIMAPSVERDTLRLSSGIDFETGTFIEPLGCCVRAVRRHANVQDGDAVLVIGLGVMGLLMIQLARLYGAGVVIGSDYLADRRGIARALGANLGIDPTREPIGEAVRDATDGRGADAVIVCPGTPEAVAQGLSAAAPGARVVCFTPLPPDNALALDLSELYFREITLGQSYSCGPTETRQALRLLDAGFIRTTELVTHRVLLAGVDAALGRAAGKSAGLKSIVYPNHRDVLDLGQWQAEPRVDSEL